MGGETHKKTKHGNSIILAVITVCIFLIVVLTGCAQKENGSQIEQELELAQEYLDTLEYEQAIALYEQILAIDPTNRDALLGLSKAYTGIAGTEDDFEKRIQALGQAIDYAEQGYELYPKDTEIQTVLIEAYFTAGDLCADNGRYEDAIGYYEKIVGLELDGDLKDRQEKARERIDEVKALQEEKNKQEETEREQPESAEISAKPEVSEIEEKTQTPAQNTVVTEETTVPKQNTSAEETPVQTQVPEATEEISVPVQIPGITEEVPAPPESVEISAQGNVAVEGAVYRLNTYLQGNGYYDEETDMYYPQGEMGPMEISFERHEFDEYDYNSLSEYSVPGYEWRGVDIDCTALAMRPSWNFQIDGDNISDYAYIINGYLSFSQFTLHYNGMDYTDCKMIESFHDDGDGSIIEGQDYDSGANVKILVPEGFDGTIPFKIYGADEGHNILNEAEYITIPI